MGFTQEAMWIQKEWLCSNVMDLMHIFILINMFFFSEYTSRLAIPCDTEYRVYTMISQHQHTSTLWIGGYSSTLHQGAPIVSSLRSRDTHSDHPSVLDTPQASYTYMKECSTSQTPAYTPLLIGLQTMQCLYIHMHLKIEW